MTNNTRIPVYKKVYQYTAFINKKHHIYKYSATVKGGEKEGGGCLKFFPEYCTDVIIMVFVPDPWQREVLEAEGNICLCSGRQVGKSEIIALKTATFILKNPKKRVLIISITEQQAELMLQKILLHLHELDKNCISKGKDKPTKHKVVLKNGSYAITKALGQYGLGALGLTMDVVVPDECAYLPESIWAAITPMLLTTGGHLWLLSTPNAQEGYFYEAYTNPAFGFKTFHVNSEEVARARPEPMRSIMLGHLEREKQRMSPMEYAQQYLAQFQEELGQLFPDSLIQSAQSLERIEGPVSRGTYFLGVDVARMGGDETTFEILERLDGKYYHRESIVHKYTLTTETIAKVLELELLYHFKNIYIDDGGLGVAVFDQLLNNHLTKSKVVAINNASRSLEVNANRTRRLLKEDLYLNFLALLEKGELFLLKDSNIFTSLKSIMIEHDASKANIKIYGRYSHITEGLIRAAWSNHSTRLELWAR